MRLVIIAWASIAFSLSLQAQVSVKWQPDNSFFISPDQIWHATVINSGQEIKQAFLKVRIQDKQSQLLFESYTAPFALAKGVTTISPISVTVTKTEYFNNKTREIASSTGRFPSDEYIMCIEVFDATLNESLSQDCREKSNVNFSPPRLRTPEDGASINPQRLLLGWIPPKPVFADADIRYKIRIVEILPNQTAIEALNINPTWFQSDNLTTTSLIYPNTGNIPEVGKHYAWQVEAYSGEKSVGFTEVWNFQIENFELKEEETTGSFAILLKDLSGQTYKTDRYLKVSFTNEDATNAFSYDFFDAAGNKVSPKTSNVFKSLGDNKYVLDLKKHTCFDPGEYYYLEIRTRNYEVYKLRFQYTK